MHFDPLGAGLWVASLIFALGAPAMAAQADPLPSWKEGPARKAILDFVKAVTAEGAPTFVPIAERIAVFDNDGTLWTEQPYYIQLQFALDRVKALAPGHPDWKGQQPFQAILEGDRARIAAMSEHDAAAVLAATHAGMTPEAFVALAREWFRTARHPTLKKPFKECIYAPMLELLSLLRARGFTVYIVSGGGVDFLRAVAEELYGVPPAQVIGSSGKTRFEVRDGQAVLLKLPELGSIDDGPGKPVNINLHIGQRPILAFGNSDGDLQMLQYTASNKRPNLELLLHHDDAERETAYDREAKVGKLDKALDEARNRKWTVVSMKEAWKRVWP